MSNPFVWKNIMEGVLLPAISSGSATWKLSSRKVCDRIHQAWRRGYRQGLGIPSQCSLTDIFGPTTFKEAEDLLIRQQLLSIWRVRHSANDIVSNFIIQPETQEQNHYWNRIVIPGRRNMKDHVTQRIQELVDPMSACNCC